MKGDWAEERPDVRPGGWAFQYNNAYYPDLDDTAVVVMALDRAGKDSSPNAAHDMPIARGAEWVEGLQSRNGGWGAFDADNAYYYLNNIPFADHGALLDPPTEDVTGRCIGMLAQLGEPTDSPRMKAAIDYLARVQLKDGSWFGRWGVNYVYGTWSALAGLNAAGLSIRNTPMMRRPSNGWSRSRTRTAAGARICDSYKLDYKAYEPAPSTASQTAWALLGLMAAGERRSSGRGARHRVAQGQSAGRWAMGPGVLHRRRFPARVLSALSRLSEIFPALGAGALPQSEGEQFPPRGVRACERHRRRRPARAKPRSSARSPCP